MWANAQPDGRPAKHRWRPLFNAAKFGRRPLLECRAVTLPRRETRWNLLGCPKLPNGSQLVAGILWGHVGEIYCCLTSFFSDCRCMTYTCEDIAQQRCAMVPRWPIFGDFFGPVFSSEQHAAHFTPAYIGCILNSQLGPHHVSKCGRYLTCDRWD